MKTICIRKLILICLFIALISCGNDNSNINIKDKNVKESVSARSEKNEKTNANTSVFVEAIIDGEKIIFDDYDPKYKSVVVLFNESIQLKFTDINNKTVLVHLYDSKLYDSSPITFSQQIASLPREEQVLVKVKASKLSISNTLNDEGKIVSISELIDGNLILKEFTETKIVITFKGNGFLVGANNAKDKLFPMEGKIIIENYSIYDAR